MRSRSHLLLTLYQLCAGLSDTLTGVLLLAAPVWTLRLLRIAHPPDPPAYTSFVGAFVLGVGLTYLWELLRLARGQSTPDAWESQWRCTALLRACVAVFLFARIATGQLDTAWSMVAVSDGALALFQAVGLQRGWLRPERGRSLA